MKNSFNKDFSKYLLKSEQIIWFGQPEPAILFSPSDIFLIPFSFLFGIPATIWEIQAFLMIQNNGIADFIYGIPFLLIGLYLVIGRFVYKKWKKRRTYYAITSRRIIILTKIWGTHFKNIHIKSISEIRKDINPSGSGTLIFKEHSSFFRILFKIHFSVNNTGLDILPFYSSEIGFYDIPKAGEVYRLITEIK